jgi:hypothetical protein
MEQFSQEHFGSRVLAFNGLHGAPSRCGRFHMV